MKKCSLYFRVGHDNAGGAAAWHLDRIEIVVNGRKLNFPCNKWLDKKKDDGLIERELYREGLTMQEALQCKSSSSIVPV